jgi:hypothetical protein
MDRMSEPNAICALEVVLHSVCSEEDGLRLLWRGKLSNHRWWRQGDGFFRRNWGGSEVEGVRWMSAPGIVAVKVCEVNACPARELLGLQADDLSQLVSILAAWRRMSMLCEHSLLRYRRGGRIAGD